MRASVSMKRTLGAIAAVVAAGMVVPSTARAETIYFRDIHGVWHHMDSEAYPKRPESLKLRVQTRSIDFNVMYDDVFLNNNKGFDDPSLGAARRAAIDRALQTIGGVLNESGVCDIIFTVSETDGQDELASAGPFYSGSPSFQGGTAFTHITTGTDPFGSVPDIEATVDFGRAWHEGAGAPPNNEFDLETVVLHELTHGLGIVSLATSSGGSEVAPNVYSTFDNLLFTGNGKDLFVGPTPHFNGVASDLAGTANGVFFHGPSATQAFGSRPPIFAPNPFQRFSSLSHWNTPSFNSDSEPRPVMLHSIPAGVMRRSYKPFERAALADLGYTVFPPGPTPTPGPIPTQSPGGSMLLFVVLTAIAGLTLSSALARATAQNRTESR